MSATDDGDRNSYTYDLNCSDAGGDVETIHVQAAFALSTTTAQEQLTTDAPGGIRAKWSCPQDPWIAPTPPACSNLEVQGGDEVDTGTELCAYFCLPVSQSLGYGSGFGSLPPVPFSAAYLDDEARLVLFQAQLQYAVKRGAFLATKVTPVAPSGAILAAQQAAAEASQQAAFLATKVTPITTTTNCAACSAVVATPTPQANPYHDPTIVAGWPQLSLYTQGEAVTSLQYLLQKSAPTLSVDGKFGPDTDAAVRAFQKAQVPQLTADGQVGQQTWLALIVTVQQGSQGAAVKAVQSQLNVPSRLNARGGQAVVVDGNFGSQTDAAVKTYQGAHPGLMVDGQVGPQTWKPLLAGS